MEKRSIPADGHRLSLATRVRNRSSGSRQRRADRWTAPRRRGHSTAGGCPLQLHPQGAGRWRRPPASGCASV
eukprot:2065902-Rhodomonas_salina.4